MNEPTFKPLRAFSDSRGYSYFDIFGEPTSGQINIGHLTGTAIKAFHYHKQQWDHWFCVNGDIHVIVFKPTEKVLHVLDYTLDEFYHSRNGEGAWSSPDPHDQIVDIHHFYIGEHNPGVISIPPGWAHGYCNVSQDSDLLYWVTKAYDKNEPDEYRIKYDIFGVDIWKPENK